LEMKEAMFLGLHFVCSDYRACRRVKIRPPMGGPPRPFAVIRQLASGEIMTAAGGTIKHSYIRILRMFVFRLLIEQLEKYPLTPFLRFIIDLCKLGTVDVHHSDDLLIFLFRLIMELHCLINDQMFYARFFNALLKFEGAIPNPMQPREDVIEFAMPKVRDFLNRFGLTEGTAEGVLIDTGKTIDPFLNYDYYTRYKFSYKQLFTTPERDGAVFLKWQFKPDPHGKKTNTPFFPYRDPITYLVKLVRNNKVLTPAQQVYRIRGFLYLTVGSPVVHAAVTRIEAAYRAHHGLTSDSELYAKLQKDTVDPRKIDEFRYSIGDLRYDVELKGPPTYEDVMNFYSINFDNKKVLSESMRAFGSQIRDHMISPYPLKPNVAAERSTIDRLEHLRTMLREK